MCTRNHHHYLFTFRKCLSLPLQEHRRFFATSITAGPPAVVPFAEADITEEGVTFQVLSLSLSKDNILETVEQARQEKSPKWKDGDA
ncbi:hypothetical protein Tco_0846756 [Tanacetum coccineum]